MYEFNPRDPFPLLPIDKYNYQRAKNHSEQVDNYFGLQTLNAELEISKTYASFINKEIWRNLPIASLMTPYIEFRMIIEQLELNYEDIIVDLGSAYGRLGFLIQYLKLPFQFYGYEICEQRSHQAKKFYILNGLNPNHLFTQDISSSDFEIPSANAYFIYDFGSKNDFKSVFEKLRVIAQKSSIKVIARGRLTKHLIFTEQPWLSQIHPPQVFDYFTIFKS